MSLAIPETTEELRKLLTYHQELYDRGEPEITDAEYDELYKHWDESNGFISVSDSKHEQLPFWAGSLSKVYSIEKVDRWIKRNNYSGTFLIQGKYDGMSATYDGKTLYTKGNGWKGQNISRLLPLLNLPKIDDLIVRGELILKKSKFSEIGEGYKDSRNLVTSSATRLESNGMEQHFDFIAFEVVNRRMTIKDEVELLKSLGFNVAQYVEVPKLTLDLLLHYSSKFQLLQYDVDGIVVSFANERTRHDGKDPQNSIAFKVRGIPIETTVRKIEWNPSKRQLYIPTVIFDEIIFEVKDEEGNITSTTKVSRATGHNAGLLKRRGIGIGSKIGVIKAGKIIPYILNVYEESDQLDLPDDAEWINAVNVKCSDNNEKVKIKKLSNQFNILRMPNIREAKSKELIKLGVKDLFDIFRIDVSSVLKQEQIDSILDLLQELSQVQLLELSGLFTGMATDILTCFVNKYPKFLDPDFNKMFDQDDWYRACLTINGFGDKRAEIISNNIYDFFDWYGNNIEYIQFKENESTTLLEGYFFCFSGCRPDDKMKNDIFSKGGRVTPSVTKATTTLVYNGQDNTIKYKKAAEKNLEIITMEEFKQMLTEF